MPLINIEKSVLGQIPPVLKIGAGPAAKVYLNKFANTLYIVITKVS